MLVNVLRKALGAVDCLLAARVRVQLRAYVLHLELELLLRALVGALEEMMSKLIVF